MILLLRTFSFSPGRGETCRRSFDHIATESETYISSELERGGLIVKAVSDDALRHDILTETQAIQLQLEQ